MAGKRTRRRRGHPRGKAYGFHGLRPASASPQSKSDSSGTQGTSGSSSTPTQTSGTSS